MNRRNLVRFLPGAALAGIAAAYPKPPVAEVIITRQVACTECGDVLAISMIPLLEGGDGLIIYEHMFRYTYIKERRTLKPLCSRAGKKYKFVGTDREIVEVRGA